jgi:hypothetical protein
VGHRNGQLTANRKCASPALLFPCLLFTLHFVKRNEINGRAGSWVELDVVSFHTATSHNNTLLEG